jgi:hypothetical protein
MPDLPEKTIRIGGASGYWGDAALATPQLLGRGRVDYLVYDYLAEITMSILARARATNDTSGYATDFVRAAMKPNLAQIAAQGVKVIANAGGVNPRACAEALRALIGEAGLGLKVGVVTGDDLLSRAAELCASGLHEMFKGQPLPPPERIASINAYLGAFPIAAALEAGADIVVTGRCVDSAVTLGACVHAFGWRSTDYDRLAAGSLAGHVIECGTQATGGNFTDWESVAGTMVNAGYPIAEIRADGSFVCTKADGTGGTVTIGTIAEQMLYEIGDPRAYLLPDASCDFSGVTLQQEGDDRVLVRGAVGRPPPATYKVSATYADGFRGGEMWTVYGRNAERRARATADLALARARDTLQALHLPDFTETSVEIVGSESHYGAARARHDWREVQLKVAARHPSEAGIATLFKEFVGCALASPPGLTGFAAGRPQPSPVVRLFSFLLPKEQVPIQVEVEGTPVPCAAAPLRSNDEGDPLTHAAGCASGSVASADAPPAIASGNDTIDVPLERLAWARSGDKGDNVNIGVIAREARYMPYLWAALTEARVATRFAHFLQGRVERFFLPGLPAMNFVLHEVLGGAASQACAATRKARATRNCCCVSESPFQDVSWRPVHDRLSEQDRPENRSIPGESRGHAGARREIAVRRGTRRASFGEATRPFRGALAAHAARARHTTARPGHALPRALQSCELSRRRSDRETSVPGGSLICCIGFVSGARCLVVADDSGINAGAVTPTSVPKILGALDIALKHKLPFIHLVESAGANLLQYAVETWAHGGGLYYRRALFSAAGIPTLSVLHGLSTAGGAYQPGLSDYVVG